MEKTALVLGATGGIGGESAKALLRGGWQVRALTRRADTQDDGIDWIKGDVLDAAAVANAAKGAQVIVHAVNPPGYRNWDRLVLPMLDNSIAAARAVGARVALPGTIYNYDPRMIDLAAPDTAQQPNTRKGAIRVEMEKRLSADGVRSLILRAGDYFGPKPGSSWLSQGMVTPGRPVSSVLYPGFDGIGHAWAYLPDVGEAFARLLAVESDLPDAARFHFAGHWLDRADIVGAIGRAIGKANVPSRRLPWRLLPLVAPFNATMREMIEMEPFWRHPLALDNCTLVETIGPEPHTPIDQAMLETLGGLGCLPAAATGAAPRAAMRLIA